MIIRNDNITEASLGSASDLNASVFLSKVSAVGGKITPSMITAVDTLFKDLKSNNLWDKILAFYPLVGGTSSSCAIEGKGTSRYDLFYTDPSNWGVSGGSMTFSDDGIWSDLFTGTAQYPPIMIGESGIKPSVFFPSVNDLHMGVYSRTTRGAIANFIFGPAQINSQRTQLNINYDGSHYAIIGDVASIDSVTSTGTNGFFIASRTSVDYLFISRNGLNIGANTNSNSGGSLDNSNPFALMAENANIEAAFFTLGLGLTEAETAIYTSIVQNFQTSLGREVPIYDADFLAFNSRVESAGGTLSSGEKSATDKLVKDLKSAGVWSKIKALYPYVGGSLASCAQNLKSSSFAGTFEGIWSIDSTGVTGDRASTYMNTGIIPNSTMDYTSQHYLVYIPTGVDGSSPYECLLGAVDSGSNGINFYLNAEGNAYMTINEFVTTNAFSPQSGNGSWMVNLLSGTKTLYRNGSVIDTKSSSPTSYTLGNIWVGARNSENPNHQWSGKTISCVSIGDGLTNTEATDLYNAIQTFQTSLSREV